MSKPIPTPKPTRSKELAEVYERYTYWHQQFFQQNNYLRGRLLTLADAGFADAQQRKAFKDLLNQCIDDHFVFHMRDSLVCLYNETCNILHGEPLFETCNILHGEPLFADREEKSFPTSPED